MLLLAILSTRVVEENEAMSTMAEDLELEVQSNIYTADWSSLEQMARSLRSSMKGRENF